MSLTTKGHFKIGNLEFAAASIKPIFDSLADSNSGRVESGNMVLHFIKQKLRKWEITMPPLSTEDTMTVNGVQVPILTALIGAVQGKQYNLTIFDISTNSEVVVQCYTSNGTADMYSGVLYNGMWRGFKFSAISTGVNDA